VHLSSQPAQHTQANTQNNHCNIGVQQNNTTNNYQILVFPRDGEDFDFITDHIKDTAMQECVTHKRPQIGFNKFMGQVLQNPRNRIVKKNNPNNKFSKIHVGEGKWEFALDQDVIPVVTHHMTTAALQKVSDMKQSLRQKAREFVTYIDEVNTNDESKEYGDALDRVKVLLINLFLKGDDY
jgi:hypothetical protein